MKHIWEKSIGLVKNQINPQFFQSFIKPLRFLSNTDTTISIGVPDTFFKNWVEDHYHAILRDAIKQYTQRDIAINFVVNKGMGQHSESSATDEQPEAKEPTACSFTGTQMPYTKTKSNLNPRYTFETFVVGASNQFAHAACYSVAEEPGMHYNPLFIYGGSGLGKTHLITAIGLRIREKQPNFRISYTTFEKFMNTMIEAIRCEKMEQFREKYRKHCDVLLIDDIQFISGKERTQEEFFHTFNALYESNKQVILTSDRPPKEIPGLEERLRSRFEMGLIADIQPPEIETRVAILQKKAELEKLKLDNEVCFFLASHVQRNIRELEGCIHRLKAFQTLTGNDMTIELVKDILSNTITGTQQTLTVEAIKRCVASHFNIRPLDLTSAKKQKVIAVPRQIAMYLCRHHLKESFPEIGMKFGGKDHTTVMHAVKKVEKRMAEDTFIKNSVETIQKSLLSL